MSDKERLSVPGRACIGCGTIMGQSLKCSDCGWIDPPTLKIPEPPTPLSTFGKAWNDFWDAVTKALVIHVLTSWLNNKLKALDARKFRDVRGGYEGSKHTDPPMSYQISRPPIRPTPPPNVVFREGEAPPRPFHVGEPMSSPDKDPVAGIPNSIEELTGTHWINNAADGCPFSALVILSFALRMKAVMADEGVIDPTLLESNVRQAISDAIVENRPLSTTNMLTFLRTGREPQPPVKAERRFPIQGEYADRDIGLEAIPATSVPWAEAEIAYQTYSALYGTQQSLERLAERGGFGRDEFLIYRSGRGFDGKRVVHVPLVLQDVERAARIEQLERTLAEQDAQLKDLQGTLLVEATRMNDELKTMKSVFEALDAMGPTDGKPIDDEAFVNLMLEKGLAELDPTDPPNDDPNDDPFVWVWNRKENSP